MPAGEGMLICGLMCGGGDDDGEDITVVSVVMSVVMSASSLGLLKSNAPVVGCV